MTNLEEEASAIVRDILDACAGRVGYATWALLDEHLITAGQGVSPETSAFAESIVSLARTYQQEQMESFGRRWFGDAVVEGPSLLRAVGLPVVCGCGAEAQHERGPNCYDPT